MEIILLSIFLVAWILVNLIILKSGMITPVPPLTPLGVGISPVDAGEMAAATKLRTFLFGLISIQAAREVIRLTARVIPANKYNIFFQLLLLTAFLLLIFLGPHIQALNDAEKKTRKEFEELAENTAKGTENIADKVLKQPWLDAISKRNRYYMACFTAIAFIPFFYMCMGFYSSPAPPFARDGITSQAVYNKIAVFDILILEFTAVFVGLVVLLYTIFSKKSWYFYIVPAFYLFSFLNADTAVPVHIRNYSIALLLALWPFFYFSKTSFLWTLPFIILIPFVFLIL